MLDHYYKVSFSEKNSFYYRFYNGRTIKDEIIYDKTYTKSITNGV